MRVDLLWALDALLTGSVLFLSGFTLRHHVTLSRMQHEVQTAQRELENRLGTIQQQTGFDALTGLRNPQMFQAKLSTLLRENEPLGAIRLAVRRWAALDNLFRRGSAADGFFLIVERARSTVGIQLAEQLLSALRAVGLSASFGVMFRTLFPIEDSDSQPDSVPIPSPPSDPRFALLIVCIVIAIERFCFHVLFSLYTLFQMAELGQTEAQATLQFGVFTSIMYFTPIVGGPVADRAGRWPGILVGIALVIRSA